MEGGGRAGHGAWARVHAARAGMVGTTAVQSEVERCHIDLKYTDTILMSVWRCALLIC